VSNEDLSANADEEPRLQADRRALHVIEQVLDAIAAMDEPLRERWVAAMNAHQYNFRTIEPDRDLDPTDKGIPEEEFAEKMHVYLTDEGEFSSIIVPIPRRRRLWPFQKGRR
jgi:hypothetical protein